MIVLFHVQHVVLIVELVTVKILNVQVVMKDIYMFIIIVLLIDVGIRK